MPRKRQVIMPSHLLKRFEHLAAVDIADVRALSNVQAQRLIKHIGAKQMRNWAGTCELNCKWEKENRKFNREWKKTHGKIRG
ncbi:MAG: hypothetical protein NTY48_04060 [Candidatus Diapherotrites archaeon]|nr:hypothetical protein [Candidatus Diapherotrites archaeon]